MSPGLLVLVFNDGEDFIFLDIFILCLPLEDVDIFLLPELSVVEHHSGHHDGDDRDDSSNSEVGTHGEGSVSVWLFVKTEMRKMLWAVLSSSSPVFVGSSSCASTRINSFQVRTDVIVESLISVPPGKSY